MGWAAVEASRRTAHRGLLGREKELAGIACALETARLVTLTGAPGIGKTRLALAVGGDYPEPTVVVELASITDPGLVPSTLATALSLQEVPGQSMIEIIVASLRRRHVLLVLDNCEHLRDACACTVGELLASCPDVRVLATSRERLGSEEELVWFVPPLPVPDESEARATLAYPAIALFAERAAEVRPEFAMNAVVARDVANICRRLDGIPLAIELAAARIATMTVHEIAQRLDAHVELPSDHHARAASRHRSLDSALQWSSARPRPVRTPTTCLGG